VATNAMCMLLTINTASITLIPVTALALLAAAKGKNYTIIIGTSLAATACTQIFAIGACKLLERTRWSKRALEEAPVSRETAVAPEQAVVEGAGVEARATEADETLPWVPGSKWILAGFAGIFVGMVLGMTFPQLLDFSRAHLGPAIRSLGLSYPVPFDPPVPLEHRWPLRLVSALSLLVLPWLILLFPFYAALRRIPVYEQFVEGGKEAVQVILRILPYLVGMLAAVGMFSVAGGMDLITWILSPVTNFFHFPSQLVPMAVIRPFSSAAALGLLTDLIKSNGPDNIISLMAATFYGCSETTFYVIAVYFGSVGIRKSRHAILAGIVADTVGPIAAVIICRAVLG